MTRVQAIEEQIKSLSPGELAELRDWLLEHDWAEWDRQIEQDSTAKAAAFGSVAQPPKAAKDL